MQLQRCRYWWFIVDKKKAKNKKKTREEQNVKRRVYDALNVLIAAGVLRKHQKTVSFQKVGSTDHPKTQVDLEKEDLQSNIVE